MAASQTDREGRRERGKWQHEEDLSCFRWRTTKEDLERWARRANGHNPKVYQVAEILRVES